MVAKISPEPNSGCWLWEGAWAGLGYGALKINKRMFLAHRVVYEYSFGLIPAGLQLDHKCRIKCCVNPEHLEPVTAQENTLRNKGLAAQNAAKTHCIKGHLLSPENTYVYRNGRRRHCKICIRDSKAKRKLAHVV
jgi:hypothetical protein